MSKIRLLGTADKIWPVESRKTIVIPYDDLVVEGKLEIYPEVENKGYFVVRFGGRTLILTAGRYIGLIPVNPRVTVHVSPKLPVGNLLRIIEISRRQIGSLGLIERTYDTEPVSPVSIIEFLARNLLLSLRDLETHGLHKIYVEHTENSSSPRGRIDFRRTALLNFSRGIRHKVYHSYYEQTADNDYNRLLKYALWFITQRLLRVPHRNRALLHDLNTALARFDSIGLHRPAPLVQRVENDLRRRRVPPNRLYYERPLRIALTILSGRGVSLVGHGDEVELSSYIIDFEKLFEDYLRESLRVRVSELVPGASVRSGATEPKQQLFEDTVGSTAEADIIVDLPPDRRVVAEVKYRDKAEREDINQAITYGCSFKVKNTVLVFQSPVGKPSELRRLGATNGVNVYTYAFDLSNSDLEAEEKKFAEVMQRLAEPCRK